MFHVYDGIVVVELVGTGVKAYVIDEVQCVDRLQQAVVLATLQMLDHCLRGIEYDSLLELVVPIHLHLHDEMATARLLAAHVHNTILFPRIFRYHLWG